MAYQDSLNSITTAAVMNKIGGNGAWIGSQVFWSNTRNMARFGLLMLANGNWNSQSVLADIDYVTAATNTSQELNKSYGYLWWLNGKESFMLPSSQFVFAGSVIPNAPEDMFMALGKNDQKIHVVPSKGWVLVRMGEAYDADLPVPTAFDNLLWGYLNNMTCTTPTTTVMAKNNWVIKNDAVTAQLKITWPSVEHWEISAYSLLGQLIWSSKGSEQNMILPLQHQNQPLFLKGKQGKQLFFGTIMNFD